MTGGDRPNRSAILSGSGTKECLWYNALALLNAGFASVRSKEQSVGTTLVLLDRVFVFRNR
ncbi:MAG: hypothetical protein EAZ79_30230 [Oscillatoriales cyanobacterium]|nr:MAG: hypothetical protein EAZ79_30230 [Oscillatoriales cyanobacterium]